MLKNKKWYLVVGVLTALALLIGTAGLAYAQSSPPSTEPESSLNWGSLPGAGAVGRVMAGRGPFPGGPLSRSGARVGPGRHLLEVTADITGLSEDEIVAALKDGQTIAEIAESAGAEPQEIVETALAEAKNRLQEAVDEGRLSEERMEQMLEHLAEVLPDRLEQPWQPAASPGGLFGRFGHSFWTMYDAVADALGLAPGELFDELHAGKSVADVAEAEDVEMSEIREALEEARVEAKKQAIEDAAGNGRITREHADWLLEGIEQEFVPRGRALGGGRRIGPRRGGCGRGTGW